MRRQGSRTIMRERYECLENLGGCGAARGEHCHAPDGHELPDVHAARWDQYLGRGAPSGKQLAARAGSRR